MTKHQHHTYDILIEAQSPLHIGSGQELTSTGEYFADDSSVYLLNNDELMQHLQQKGLLRDYIGRIDVAGIALNFDEELAQLFEIDVQALREQLKTEFTDKELRFNSGDEYDSGTNNIMRRHIRTNELAYIPGSSLKGAIRTAIVAERLRADADEMRRFNDYIDDCISEGSASPIARNWAEFERRFATPDKQLPDYLRVSDSATAADTDVVVEQVVRQNFYGTNTDGLDWLCECIAPKAEVPTTLTVYTPDDKLNDDLLTDNFLRVLLQTLNAHTKRLIEIDLQLIQAASDKAELRQQLTTELNEYLDLIQNSKNKYAIARLGQGKSLHYQTIAALIDDRTKRDEFMQIITNRYKKEGKDPTVPRSRSLTSFGQMLGWVKIRENKAEAETPHNTGAIAQGTPLQILVSDTKRADFILNDASYTEVQMTIPKGVLHPPIDTVVNAVIHQVTKDFRIVQVKYTP